MKSKQALNKSAVTSKRKSESKSTSTYEEACRKGYCPTSKEIEDDTIKSLANRLNGSSHEETLTNVLEWQEKNIDFWIERWPLLPFFYFSLISVVIILASVAIVLLAYSQVLWWLVAIGLTVPTMTFLIIMVIMHYFSGIPLKEMKNEIGLLENSSIPANILLEKKRGVCRDYAKLTACLLSNIYPDSEIYFIITPIHAATGIKIDELYMLDQQLPVLTIDKWYKLRCSHRSHLTNLLQRLNFRKPPYAQILKGKHLEQVEDFNSLLPKTNSSEPNTERLLETIRAQMNKQLPKKEQTSDAGVLTLNIRWKKGVIRYEDNEIVNYSLARWLKKQLFNEFLELNQILEVKPTVDKDKKNDVIFQISYCSKFAKSR
jgi:predicted transglutaminase-like protease